MALIFNITTNYLVSFSFFGQLVLISYKVILLNIANICMTLFEILYSAMRPFFLSLHRIAHEDIKRLSVEKFDSKPLILDVGGRKSHITIGVPGKVKISDIPRLSEVQESLSLGINTEIIDQIKKRRSNIETIIYDDMTHSNLPDNSFDICSAVEVLEHVEEDQKFANEVYRVLKPGGYFYMTTPNGDWKPTPTNVDHKRHYKKQELQSLLSGVFDEVIVEYAVVASDHRRKGIKVSISSGHRLRTLKAMLANYKNYRESILPEVKQMANGTAHLIAIAHKKKD